MSPGTPRVTHLPAERAHEAVATLVDAFHDYPVMRYAVGEAGADYDRRLDLLIRLFVGRRMAYRHPVLAVEDGGAVVGIATLTPPPGDPPPPTPEVEAERAALWSELGEAARQRMERLVEVWERLKVNGSHYHLNMLGVRRSRAGQGIGRILLDEVHRLSREHPDSAGVSLSTEDPKNVLLYQHCGYEVRHHERVAPDLETWILFRNDD